MIKQKSIFMQQFSRQRKFHRFQLSKQSIIVIAKRSNFPPHRKLMRRSEFRWHLLRNKRWLRPSFPQFSRHLPIDISHLIGFQSDALVDESINSLLVQRSERFRAEKLQSKPRWKTQNFSHFSLSSVPDEGKMENVCISTVAGEKSAFPEIFSAAFLLSPCDITFSIGDPKRWTITKLCSRERGKSSPEKRKQSEEKHVVRGNTESCL